MKPLINLARFTAVIFSCAALCSYAQNTPEPQEASATGPRPTAPARAERVSVESRLQQMISQQFARVMTKEQRTNYQAALAAEQGEQQKLQQEIRGLRAEMLALQLAESYDEAKFQTKAEAAARLQAKSELLNARAFAKIRPSLSSEQMSQLRNMPTVNRLYGVSEVRPGVFPRGVEPPAPAMHNLDGTNAPAGEK